MSTVSLFAASYLVFTSFSTLVLYAACVAAKRAEGIHLHKPTQLLRHDAQALKVSIVTPAISTPSRIVFRP